MQSDDMHRRFSRLMSPLTLVTLALLAATSARCADATDSADPLLNLFIKKGYVSKEEADKVKAEADYDRTNALAASMPQSKWVISRAMKDVELFGDIRLRYEDRQSTTSDGGRIELGRFRYSLRFGLRGDVLDDFYYGLRLDTSSNPRSTWVTFGSSTSGTYQGPFGKSTSTLGIGQIYLGWRPQQWDWFDLTVGKMPNPLYTTPMVWSPSINPEGLAERFKYQVGEAEFFANFGQFWYQDANPDYSSPGLISGVGLSDKPLIMAASQLGVKYDISEKVTAKIAATLYNYVGVQTGVSPYFGDTYVGEGQYTGPGSTFPVNGNSGFGTSSTTLYPSLNYPNNQVGINDLLVIEVPFEVTVKLKSVDVRGFGDVAYNLDGRQRAKAAAAGYAAYLSQQQATISGFSPQTRDVMAYQFGMAVGSHNNLGQVYGLTSGKHAWEFRTYWQHVEQYSLDPNLLDQDFFEGNENLEGVYAALSYSPFANVIATVRYGYASRINNKLGTGGSGQDIPQINSINTFSILQLDLGLKF
jgi:hypothetical protein